MSLRSLFDYLLNPRARLSKLPGSLSAVGGASVADLAPSETLPKRSLRRQVRQIVFNLPLMLGLLVVSGLFLVVIFGPRWATHDHYITAQTVITHYDAATKQMIKLPFPPSRENILGTDRWGNDMLSLLLTGARLTLLAGLYITFTRVLLGLVLGSMAGWKPDSLIDRLLNALMSVIGSVPMLLSGMILILAIGIQKGPWVFVVALTVIGWTEIAQMVRGEMIVIRNKAYVEGAQAVGLNNLQIVVRHALPNLLPQLLVIGALEMGAVLILLAELGFLGLFIGGSSYFSYDPVFGGGAAQMVETAEWGALLAYGTPSLRTASFLVFGPAMAFFIAIGGFNALGEGLRRWLARGSLNTAVLLKKRMLLALVALVALSGWLIEYTGPSFSFNRLAQAFDGAQASQFAGQVAALAAAPSAPDQTVETLPQVEFIKDQFYKAGLQRGLRTSVNSTYVTFVEVPGQDGPVQVPVLLGFLPGYDMTLCDDLVILMASFDEQDASGVGVLLEMARLWQDKNMDPRRSVMFVAWGRSAAGDFAGAQAFIENPDNFKALPVPTRKAVHPTLVIQFASIQNDAAGVAQPPMLWASPNSDPGLLELLTSAAKDIRVEAAVSPEAGSPATRMLPSLAFRWAAPQSTADLAAYGETLALTLVHILRQERW